MSIDKQVLINDFKRFIKNEIKDKIGLILIERRKKVISYLESVKNERLNENQINMAFDIDAGRI